MLGSNRCSNELDRQIAPIRFTMKPEIERRFLLKSLPKWTGPIERSRIAQFYCEDTDGSYRVRSERFENGDVVYTKTQKKNWSFGVFIEDEEVISKEIFDKMIVEPFCNRVLYKTRNRIPDQKLIWEVDDFSAPLQIVIAEIELPAIDHFFEIPTFIKQVLLMEITGMKQFSNFELAESIDDRISSLSRFLAWDGYRKMSKT